MKENVLGSPKTSLIGGGLGIYGVNELLTPEVMEYAQQMFADGGNSGLKGLCAVAAALFLFVSAQDATRRKSSDDDEDA